MYGDDALMAEFVSRNKLEQHDIDLLSQIGFQPLAHPQRAWPKFRSYRPGAIPWFLEQAEAELLLSDLRVAIAFVRLVAGKKDLYDDRADNEVPFCPENATDAMRIEDLDWQKLVLPPEPLPAPCFTVCILNWPDFTRCLKMTGFLWNWIVYIPPVAWMKNRVLISSGWASLLMPAKEFFSIRRWAIARLKNLNRLLPVVCCRP